MTNEDIIKALQCHNIHLMRPRICRECPYYDVVDCYDALKFDVINALKKGVQNDISR